MTTKTIDVHEAQSQLVELISLAASGVEVILTNGASPIARLVPLGQQGKSRIAGLHEHLGSAWVSDDFDDPLPDEFWLGTDETAAG